MTVNSDTNRVEYTGSGSTATFSYTYKIFDDDDLHVIVVKISDDTETTLTKTTDYTVTGVGVAAGGTIVLVDADQAWLDGSGYLTSSYRLVIRRIIDLTQVTSVTSQGEHLPEYIEKQFDRCLMIDQQQQDQLDRAIKMPDGEDPADFNMTLPPVADRASAGLGFDADGNPVALQFTSVGAPTGASYVTTSSEGSLGADRVLTGTAGQIAVTDNGANSTVVISIPSNATPTVSTITASSLTAGRVPIVGTSGLIEDDAGLTYAKTTDILTVPIVKFTPGAAPSLANGQQWSDSTRIAPSYYTGGMTEYGVRCIYSQVTAVQVSNDTNRATLLTTPAFGTATLAADYLTPGKVVRVIAWGTFGITGTPTLGLFTEYGGVGSIGATITTAAAGNWRLETNLAIITAGSGGTCKAGASVEASKTDGTSHIVGRTTGATSVNTTIANTIDVWVDWGAADPANSITLYGCTIEVLG